jgi:hypothetical protein
MYFFNKTISILNSDLLKIYKINSFNPRKYTFNYILSFNKLSFIISEFWGELERILIRYILSSKILLPNLNNNNNNNKFNIIECENIFQVITNQKIKDK